MLVPVIWWLKAKYSLFLTNQMYVLNLYFFVKAALTYKPAQWSIYFYCFVFYYGWIKCLYRQGPWSTINYSILNNTYFSKKKWWMCQWWMRLNDERADDESAVMNAPVMNPPVMKCPGTCHFLSNFKEKLGNLCGCVCQWFCQQYRMADEMCILNYADPEAPKCAVAKQSKRVIDH